METIGICARTESQNMLRATVAAMPQERFERCILKTVELYRYTVNRAEEYQTHHRKPSHHIRVFQFSSSASAPRRTSEF
jgi:hypothetical protein